MPTTTRDAIWLDRFALLFFAGLALIELGHHLTKGARHAQD